MHSLCLLLSLLAFSVWPVVASRNTTLQFSDSALSFSNGWQATRTAAGQLAFVFDNVGVTALIITLPPLVSQISYTGLGRSGPSLFGVCIDCNDNFTSVSVFDAHDPQLTNDALANPVSIFSIPLDSTKQHVITILDIPDNRFNGQSELTFVSITITIDDGVQTSSSTSSTSFSSATFSSTTFSISTTSVLTTTSSTSTSETASASVSAQPSNAGISTKTRNSIIAVISILSFTGLASLLLGLFFYRRRRARRISRLPVSQRQEKATTLSSQPSLKLPIMSATRATPIYGGTETQSMGPLAAAGRSRPATRIVDSGP
ncbi:hypothetical protein K435DRAFT_966706 [Dendrothele bispora CBS 962.96]|uniref:Mid2 domain-containing protein n=1 Tax=Dendrothele bispora (strain CBS 962.96) TaxID=1314807 RepID=A0A4S8LZX2_DENBC|nr:hypothetical protein K435DRAFT_966706 [Dendrothele bispora CBS 962.96]